MITAKFSSLENEKIPDEVNHNVSVSVGNYKEADFIHCYSLFFFGSVILYSTDLLAEVHEASVRT